MNHLYNLYGDKICEEDELKDNWKSVALAILFVGIGAVTFWAYIVMFGSH